MKKKFFVITVVVFSLAELCLRVIYSQKLMERHQPQIYQADSLYGYTYIPNTIDYKSTPAFYNDNISINSLGHCDQEFSIDKDIHKFRIMIVGSSNEVGLDTDGPETYISLTKKKLIMEGHAVELINCSVDGEYRDVQRIDFILGELINYNADAVLFTTHLPVTENMQYRTQYKDYQICFFNLNRLEDIKKYIDEVHYGINGINIAYKSSYIIRYLFKYYSENDNPLTSFLEQVPIFPGKKIISERVRRIIDDLNGYKPIFNDIDYSCEILKILNDSLNKQNSELYIYQLSYYDDVRSYFYDKIGCNYIFIPYTPLEEHTFGELDGHLNQKGHRALANEFYLSLLNNGVIPDAFLSKNTIKIKEKEIESMHRERDTIGVKLDLNYKRGVKNNILIVNCLNKANKKEEGYISKICSGYFYQYCTQILDNALVEQKDFFNVTSLKNAFDSIIQNINEHNYNSIIISLPYNLIRSNTKSNFKLINHYNSVLKKHNINLMFSYIYDDQNVLSYQVSNNHILKFLLNQESIPCSGTRIYSRYLSDSTQELAEQYSRLSDKLYAYNISYEFIRMLYEREGEGKVINRAFRKKACFSSSSNSIHYPDPHVALTDGVIEDFIFTTHGWLSDKYIEEQREAEWVVIDLEQKIDINRVVLHPLTKQGFEGNGFPVGFEIQVSTDKCNWQVVCNINRYPRPHAMQEQSFIFPKTSCRYIRVCGKKLRRDLYEDGESYRMGFAEIEVF